MRPGTILVKLFEIAVIFFIILTLLFFLFRMSPGIRFQKWWTPCSPPRICSI